MSSVTLRLKSIDVAAADTKINQRCDRALGIMAQNALSDCRDYIPYETGALRASGQTTIEGKHAYLLWGTDVDTAKYAAKQYEDTSLSHATDANRANAPKATDHWFEAAKASRLGAWVQMVRQIVGGK